MSKPKSIASLLSDSTEPLVTEASVDADNTKPIITMNENGCQPDLSYHLKPVSAESIDAIPVTADSTDSVRLNSNSISSADETAMDENVSAPAAPEPVEVANSQSDDSSSSSRVIDPDNDDDRIEAAYRAQLARLKARHQLQIAKIKRRQQRKLERYRRSHLIVRLIIDLSNDMNRL